MPEHRKYCTEDFELTQVMNRPPAYIFLAALIGFAIAGLIYIFILQSLFFRGGLPLAFGVMILIMMLILKTQSKNIVIYLDQRSLFIDNKRYLRQDITSIETYPYDQRERSRIYFRIYLKNGSRVNMIDTRLFERQNPQQALLLKKLLKALIKRLDLVHQPKQNNYATYTTHKL